LRYSLGGVFGLRLGRGRISLYLCKAYKLYAYDEVFYKFWDEYSFWVETRRSK
jgi:hypothetical protein